MTETAEILINEIRYSERLCLRTARLYRHLHTTATLLSVVGGSAALGALSPTMPKELSIVGAVVLAVFGAVTLAVRPAEKAAANESDAKRYAQLRTEARTMNPAALQLALDKARETDTPEFESLRDVAYNDVVVEIGRPDAAVPLSGAQRLLAGFA